MNNKTTRTVEIVLSALFLVSAASPLEVRYALADEREDALELLDEGDKLLEKAEKRRQGGREARAIHYYEKALEAYEQAYQLVPNPQLFYAIGNAEAGLKRFEKAIVHYQKVIEEVDNKPELVEAAKARIDELAPEVGSFTFRVTPKGAELSIDAELRGVAPLKHPLMLMPGKHTVTITADGYNPQEVDLDVKAGTRVDKKIALEKSSVVVNRPEDVDGGDKPNFGMPETQLLKRPSKLVPILGTVGTVGFLAGSATSLILSDFEANATLYIGIGTGVVGLGLGIYTVYHYFKVYRPRRRQWDKQVAHTGANLWLAPIVQADGGGVAVGGRF